MIVLLLKYTTSSIPGKKEDFPGACAKGKKCKRESHRWSKIKRYLAMRSRTDRNKSLTGGLPGMWAN